MKAYLANLLPRLQQFSETLDRKEILVDQSWVNVDDDLNKIHYIFRRDGSLIVSLNGDAQVGKWEYISAVKRLLLDYAGKKILLNHGFIDKGVLILKKDGFHDAPWVLINERIVTDLDAERYLNNLLKQKLHIKSAIMEDGSVFEFPDPQSQGLVSGTAVNIKGVKAVDGIYKHKGENRHYLIQEGKVHAIFREYTVPTNKGLVTIRKSVFTDDWTESLASLNNLPIPDGKYIIESSEFPLKYIITRSGMIVKISLKLTRTIWIDIISVVILMGGLIWAFNVAEKEKEVADQPAPMAETNKSNATEPVNDDQAYGALGYQYYAHNNVAAFINATNDDHLYNLEELCVPVLDRFYDHSRLTIEQLVDEIKRYKSAIVSKCYTKLDISSMKTTRNGSGFVVDMKLTEYSVLRSNNLPYVYCSDVQYFLNKDLKIYSITGTLTSKRININAVLKLDVTPDNKLRSPLTESDFNNAFSKMSSPYSPDELRTALRDALINYTSRSVQVIFTDRVSLTYLPDFCESIINNEVNFQYVRNVYTSGDEIYKIEVYAPEKEVINLP